MCSILQSYVSILTLHNSLGITHEMYLFPWMQTLYLKCLPLTITSRIWDSFLFEGTSFLFKTAVAILFLFQPVLVGGTFENTAGLLTSSTTKKYLWDKYIQEVPLFKAISNVSISTKLLNELNTIVNDPFFYKKSNTSRDDEIKRRLSSKGESMVSTPNSSSVGV